MTVDGSVVLLKVVAVGGSVTLVGRKGAGQQWQFARITVDQTEAMFGEAGDGVVRAPSVENLEWLGSWDEALTRLDRYPWARLYPIAVHPEFVDRVRAAVEERLSGVPQGSDTERVRGKWERLLERSGTQSSEGDVQCQR